MSTNRTRWLVSALLIASVIALTFVGTLPTVHGKGMARGARRPSTAQKEEEIIPCPSGRMRTEITTSLPSPWWQTPQEGMLVSNRIATIAGRRTLVCEYSAYGTRVGVMREFPAGASDCRAVAKGFRCRR